MKRFSLITIAVLLAMTLNAQISVWDGTVEPCDTTCSGTADDPILIENAAQLAYFSHLQFCEGELKYWKLTTDVDLADIEWNPIGYNDITVCSGFNGYFNGDGHTVYHLSNALFSNTDEGFIKNITVKDSEYQSNGEFGDFGFITFGAPLIENCHNYGCITIETNYPLNVGGVAGECMTMRHCSNHGSLIVKESGTGLCYAGGLVGKAAIVDISYNTGVVNVDSSCDQCKTGGVCGIISDMASSCYNAGSIVAANVGGIVADVVGSANTNNCYYINAIISANSYGTPKSESEMQTQVFVDLLNNCGNVYIFDDMNVNGGFPIFGQSYSISENESRHRILIYPNPAQNTVNVTFPDGADCQSVEIYAIDGRLLKSQISNFGTVDISKLNSGIYILKVNMADGKEFTERIVKE